MGLDCCCPLRHSILALSFLTLTLLSANVHVFNFAILQIRHHPDPPINYTSLALWEDAILEDTHSTTPAPTAIVPTTTAALTTPSTSKPTPFSSSDSTPSAAKESFRAQDVPQLYEPGRPGTTKSIQLPTTLAPEIENLSLAVEHIEDLFLALQTIEELKAEMDEEEESGYYGQELELPEHLVSSMYSSFAWGAMLAFFPICMAVRKIGLRLVLAVVGVLSGIATLCAHGCLAFSPHLFLATRIVQGFGLAAALPGLASVVVSWSALREYPAAITLLGSADEVALIFAMPLAGVLSTTNPGWPCAYYLLGILTLVVVTAWTLLYRNHPRSHRGLSGLELDTILERKIMRSAKRQESAYPWRRILTSLNTWVILTSAFGHLLILHLLIFYTPLYLHRVLGFGLWETGVFAAAPPLLCFFTKILASSLFELETLSPTVRTRALGGLGHFGSALALGGLGFVPGAHYALLLLSLAHLFLGFHMGGWVRALVLSWREEAAGVAALVAVEAFLLLTLLPYAVAEAAVSGRGWRLLWLIAGAVSGVAGVVWTVFGSVRPEPWTRGFERAFKGARKLVDGSGPGDDDAVSIDQGILELKLISPAPDPERVPLHSP